MKYMITGAEVRGESDSLDAEEIGRRVTHHQQKLDELLRARVRGGKPGLMFVSVGLGRNRETITVKNRGGEHLRIDGPFPETKELVGGFDIIDFDSEQEAIAFARYEEAHQSLVTEVRPIREFWWISQTFGQAASKMFMLTSVEDERAVLSMPESERTKIMTQHQGVGADPVPRPAAVRLDREQADRPHARPHLPVGAGEVGVGRRDVLQIVVRDAGAEIEQAVVGLGGACAECQREYQQGFTHRALVSVRSGP